MSRSVPRARTATSVVMATAACWTRLPPVRQTVSDRREPTDEEVREWAAAHGHLYDKPGPVPERVLSTLREGKTLRDLWHEAHPEGRR